MGGKSLNLAMKKKMFYLKQMGIKYQIKKKIQEKLRSGCKILNQCEREPLL